MASPVAKGVAVLDVAKLVRRASAVSAQIAKHAGKIHDEGPRSKLCAQLEPGQRGQLWRFETIQPTMCFSFNPCCINEGTK